MKALRKSKLAKSEFDRIKEIRFNYHKLIYKKNKKRIKRKGFK